MNPGPSTSAPAFTPPSPEQLLEHLRRHPPVQPSPWLLRAPLMALIGLAVLIVLTGQPAWLILALVGVAAVAVWGYARAAQHRRLEQRTVRVQELALLRRHETAMRQAWTLLPELNKLPLLHAQIVTVMAQALDRVGAHDSAVAAYGYLIDHLPPNHPVSVLCRSLRTIGYLRTDRLADADDALRQLRQAIEPYEESPIGATYHFAVLLRDVLTHHHEEAIATADTLTDTLRPLGVEAGYGHALMALCCLRQSESTGADANPMRDAALRFWSSAKLLLPADVMIRKFPQLEPLSALDG